MPQPILLMIAGPNGSGKSTITAGVEIIGDYINADEIQAYLACDPMEAAVIAEATRKAKLAAGESFTFETVLSTTRNIELAKTAKDAGYYIVCYYILTADPQINLARIEARKRKGGHNVPPEKTVARYARAMNLFPLLPPLCDELYVYDNSLDRREGSPELILSSRGGNLEIFPTSVWSAQMIGALCDGTYSPEK